MLVPDKSPEGGRREACEQHVPAKPGVAFLAQQAGVPVYVASIRGSDAALPRGRIFPRRTPVVVTFGTRVAFRTETHTPRSTRDRYRMETAEIMKAIAQMLPR